MESPAVPEVGIVALLADRFDGFWMSRHQILTRLARYFHVVWVNPAREWRDVVSGGRVDLTSDPTTPPPGLVVYDPPPLLPKFYRPRWLSDGTERLRYLSARRLLKRSGCSRIVLYMWRPSFRGALRLMPHDLSVYHISDEYTFSDEDLPIGDAERALLTECDHVFIHSPGLLEKKGQLSPHTSFLPNGVDFRAASAIALEPADLAGIPRPRIGYTGWLKKQLDWDLLADLATEHPSWSFVFVGPVAAQPEAQARVDELSQRGNVYFLGPKSHDALPSYTQHLDVCAMPYRVTDYTNHIYPLKLHEYLASGRPVVTTPIRSVREFSSVVEIGETHHEWSDALGRCLAPDACAPEVVEARRAVARQHDWDRITQEVASTIGALVGSTTAKRVEMTWEDLAPGS